uniref:Uncharacterized protein n=1 Tax=Pelusios castaneus TaxID=367368 RepID=A0A8C8SS95_9SAUR
MHLPGPPPTMTDGSFSLSAHLGRSPGPASRLHSIEAILGFPKEDGLLGAFQPAGSPRALKEADKRSPRSCFPKMPGEPPAEQESGAEEYEGVVPEQASQ